MDEIDYQRSESIDVSGQLLLSKEYAGRNVLIEIPEPGVWVVRAVIIIPDNERWLHEPEVKRRLEKALVWAMNNPAKESNVDDLDFLSKLAS